VFSQESRLEEILRQAIGRSILIFVVSGVSSGDYDTTKKLLTRVLKKRLVLNYKVLDGIRRQFELQGEEMPRTVEKRALVPTDAEILDNVTGEVPGFLFSQDNTNVVLLPGDVSEVDTMLKKHVLPRLDPKTFRFGAVNGLILKTCGLSVHQVKDRLRGLDRASRGQMINYVGNGEETSVIVTVRGDMQKDVDVRLQNLEAQIRKKLGSSIYGTGSQTLEEAVAKLLIEKKRTLSMAESCTGGLISSKLTDIPGSSEYFDRGVVSYSNEAKISLLDVSPNIIDEHGAVSAETAVAMAEGVRWVGQTSYGLAVTGIAGPSGGTPQKPVGLVYIALSSEKAETKWKRCQFSGDRLTVKMKTAQTALDMLRHQLLSE
jgi:nicotinamide-nucleotide amidase